VYISTHMFGPIISVKLNPKNQINGNHNKYNHYSKNASIKTQNRHR
jgi:hypothetical protein